MVPNIIINYYFNKEGIPELGDLCLVFWHKKGPVDTKYQNGPCPSGAFSYFNLLLRRLW
jgi:hypothetical protein